MDVDKLVEDFLEDRISLSELSDDELDQVMEGLAEIGESLLDTDKHDAGVAILEALDTALDERVAMIDMSDFEEAIQAAEARGSTFWEFDSYTVH